MREKVKEKAREVEGIEGELLTIPQRDGTTMQVHMQPNVDYSRPHTDDDRIIPEFVNISDKVQGCRMIGLDMLYVVPPLGILRGAQWRHLSKPNRKTWGNNPRFLERIKEKQTAGKDEVLYDPTDPTSAWSPARGCDFDRKYLLTEEQVIREINGEGTKEKPGMSNISRIKLLTHHAIIKDTEDVTTLGYRIKVHQGPIDYENTSVVCARPRDREDRMKINDVAMRRMDWLEEQARSAREAQGIFEED